VLGALVHVRDIRFFFTCWKIITHAIGAPFFHSLNTINVNKWNFTFLVPKVMSIDIVHYGPISKCIAIAMEFESSR